MLHSSRIWLAFEWHLNGIWIQSNAFEWNASANANVYDSNANTNANAPTSGQSNASANANAAFALTSANALAFEYKPEFFCRIPRKHHTIVEHSWWSCLHDPRLFHLLGLTVMPIRPHGPLPYRMKFVLSSVIMSVHIPFQAPVI